MIYSSLIMYKITFNADTIFALDNTIYKSKFVRNCDESEIIHLDMPIEEYYLQDRLDKLTIEQLRKYIEFWDYMLSEKHFYKGIYELCFVREQRVDISEYINDMITYLLNTPTSEYAHNNKYTELFKIMIDEKHTIYEFINNCAKINTYCDLFSYCGNLECLIYAHENGCSWTLHTCSNAALNGNLECLKYAHENGCFWNSMTCENAAHAGELECLKYAHENGCESDKKAVEFAAFNAYLVCIKYPYENGRSYSKQETLEISHIECHKYIQTYM